MARPTRAIYRYAQRLNAHLPRMTLRVEVVPFPDGLRPAGVSVMDDLTVVGTLTPAELERALLEWRAIVAEPSNG